MGNSRNFLFTLLVLVLFACESAPVAQVEVSQEAEQMEESSEDLSEVSWEEPVEVAGNGDEPARGPALAIDGQGILYLTWTVGEDEAADLRLAISDDGGVGFGEPELVAETNGHADGPAIVVDGEGAIHIAYGESPDGPLRQYHVRYARRVVGDERFEEPSVIAGLQNNEGGANFPSMGVDEEDWLYIVWEHYPSRADRPSGLGFAYSDDGGQNFSSPELIPGSADDEPGFNGSLQGSLMRKLDIGRDGEFSVVNSHFRPNDRSRVVLIRGRI